VEYRHIPSLLLSALLSKPRAESKFFSMFFTLSLSFVTAPAKSFTVNLPSHAIAMILPQFRSPQGLVSRRNSLSLYLSSLSLSHTHTHTHSLHHHIHTSMRRVICPDDGYQSPPIATIIPHASCRRSSLSPSSPTNLHQPRRHSISRSLALSLSLFLLNLPCHHGLLTKSSHRNATAASQMHGNGDEMQTADCTRVTLS
jgi:hypothetical protein